MSRSSTALILALVAAACVNPVLMSEDGTLWVQANGHHLTLVNRSDALAFYFLVERQTATVIDWMPCVDPSGDCPRVHPHDTVQVAYAQIAGYEPGAQEVIVYWWFVVSDEHGGMRPDSVRSLIVPL
jgi:hypothetical protein